MTPEERIRNKVSGLKDAQNERNIRENFDATIGSDAGEAFKTQYGGVTMDPYTGRAYHNEGQPVYSAEELQSAMDTRNTTNRLSGSIFDYVFDKTGNPNMARHAVNAATYSPGLGTAMGLEDAYQAAREIPDDYQAGDRGAMARNIGYTAMGMGDAALTMAPFAKPIFNAMKRVPKNIGRAGRAVERGMFALDDLMTPNVANNKPQNRLMQELERYLEKTEDAKQKSLLNEFMQGSHRDNNLSEMAERHKTSKMGIWNYLIEAGETQNAKNREKLRHEFALNSNRENNLGEMAKRYGMSKMQLWNILTEAEFN